MKIKQIDPSTIPCIQLTGIQLKRAKAKGMLKKYGRRSEFYGLMTGRSKRQPLTEDECDAIMRAAESFKQRDKKGK